MRDFQEHVKKRADILKQTHINLMAGTRVQMLINRAVGNTNKGSMRWVSKLISYDESTYKRNIEKLMFQMHALDNPSIRLYASVNERDHYLASKEFVCRTIDNLDDPEWLSVINDKFVSCLMNPKHRATKYFLVDCDSEDHGNHTLVRAQIGSNLLMEYPTVKGRHFITTGFDTRMLLSMNEIEPTQWVDVKRDGLMLLYWMDQE